MRDGDFEHTLATGSRAVADTVRPRPAAAIRARGEQRRRRRTAGSVLLAAILVAGGGAVYAGIHGTQSPAPVSPAARHRPGPRGTRPAPGSPPPSPAVSSSAPPTTAPATSAPAASAPAASAPAAGGTWQFGTLLPQGPYADGTNEVPHYTFTVSHAGPAVFQGTITFVFQDGRTESPGPYRATVLGGGRLAFVLLSTGQTLTGSYQSASFTLSDCGTALTWATAADLCEFSYQPGATS